MVCFKLHLFLDVLTSPDGTLSDSSSTSAPLDYHKETQRVQLLYPKIQNFGHRKNGSGKRKKNKTKLMIVVVSSCYYR